MGSMEEKLWGSIPSLVCWVNVPNFFTLPEYNGTVFESPKFEFADATWCFRFRSLDTWQRKEEDEYCDSREFGVYLIRLNSIVPQHWILRTITLLDESDKKYDDQILELLSIKETPFDENGVSIGYFKNRDPSFDRRETLCLIIKLFDEKSTVLHEEQHQNEDQYGDSQTETIKEEKNCNVTLRLSKGKSLSSVICTFEIPNIFILPEFDGTIYMSRTLAFANAAWRFRFCSSQSWESEDDRLIIISNEGIDIGTKMIRLDFEILEQQFCYTITLLSKDNIEYSKKYGEVDFEFPDFNHCCLNNLILNDSYSDRSDSLKLVIRLFYDKSMGMEDDQLQNTTQKAAEMLSQDLKILFQNGSNHDLTLNVAGKEFRAHKNILMARSPVFEAMLSHDMAEKNNGFIDVPDCDPRAMEQFLYYVYTGKVETLNLENVFGVYYTADKYNTTFLKNQCAEFIKKSFSPSIICDVIQLALNHSDAGLLACATEYFVNHTSDILLTAEWMSFMQSNPIAGNKFLIRAFKLKKKKFR